MTLFNRKWISKSHKRKTGFVQITSEYITQDSLIEIYSKDKKNNKEISNLI